MTDAQFTSGPFRRVMTRFPYALESGASMMKAQSKTGLAMPRGGGYVHVPDRLYAGRLDDHMYFAAQWKCGAFSVDAMIVSAADIAGEQRCALCADAALGPALYRFFDEHGLLLYIGSTLRFLVRRTQHAQNSKWWTEVADEHVDRYPTLLQGRLAEIDAIRAEHPKYNTIRRLKVAA